MLGDRFGVALAHANGVIWARFHDGYERTWIATDIAEGTRFAAPYAVCSIC